MSGWTTTQGPPPYEEVADTSNACAMASNIPPDRRCANTAPTRNVLFDPPDLAATGSSSQCSSKCIRQTRGAFNSTVSGSHHSREMVGRGWTRSAAS